MNPHPDKPANGQGGTRDLDGEWLGYFETFDDMVERIREEGGRRAEALEGALQGDRDAIGALGYMLKDGEPRYRTYCAVWWLFCGLEPSLREGIYITHPRVRESILRLLLSAPKALVPSHIQKALAREKATIGRLDQYACPFSPKVMVVVLKIDLDRSDGMAEFGPRLMERHSIEERQGIFQACAWYRENPDWDHFTYQD